MSETQVISDSEAAAGLPNLNPASDDALEEVLSELVTGQPAQTPDDAERRSRYYTCSASPSCVCVCCSITGHIHTEGKVYVRKEPFQSGFG